jgi:CrcB protein
MYNALAVAFGGAFGALLRFGVCSATDHYVGKDFPYGTLAVNVLGGFLVGLILTAAAEHLDMRPVLRNALIIGCLGGFTTFSAFAWDTLSLASDGNMTHALVNTAANVMLALGAVWLGAIVGRSL